VRPGSFLVGQELEARGCQARDRECGAVGSGGGEEEGESEDSAQQDDYEGNGAKAENKCQEDEGEGFIYGFDSEAYKAWGQKKGCPKECSPDLFQKDGEKEDDEMWATWRTPGEERQCPGILAMDWATRRPANKSRGSSS